MRSTPRLRPNSSKKTRSRLRSQPPTLKPSARPGLPTTCWQSTAPRPSISPDLRPPWHATASPYGTVRKKESRHELVRRTPEQPRPGNRPARSHLGYRRDGRDLWDRDGGHRRRHRHHAAPDPPRWPGPHAGAVCDPVVDHRQYYPFDSVCDFDGRAHSIYPVARGHLDWSLCGHSVADDRHGTVFRSPGRNLAARSEEHTSELQSRGHIV